MHTFSITSLALSLLSLSTTVSSLPVGLRGLEYDNKRGLELRATQATAVVALNQNFPDPSFIKTNNGYYAFATSSSSQFVQIAQSSSFSNPQWTMLNTEPLPDPGPWTDRTKNIWAPYVTQAGSGSFVMYYSARPSSDPTKHCVGTATSSKVTGPYTPSQQPFACDLTQGGAIDPFFFKDPASGNAYVIYKIDGNSLDVSGQPNHATPIMIQQVNPTDGITPIGAASELLAQDPNAAVDGPLVEAPAMFYNTADKTYYLLFSTHLYNTEAYDVRYVTASSPIGPFTAAQTVLLKTGDGNGVVAPGSCDVHVDGTELTIAFHGTVSPDPNLSRSMYTGFLQAGNGVLSFKGMA